MAIFKQGREIADQWIEWKEDQAPNVAAVQAQLGGSYTGLLLSLAQWLALDAAQQAELRNSNIALAIALKAGDQLDPILPLLPRLAMVALDFASFGDGRHYSSARLLRERHKFSGELRATGNILIDQLSFYARCGIDCIDATDPRTIEYLRAGHQDPVSLVYQPASDAQQPIFQRRAALRRDQELSA